VRYLVFQFYENDRIAFSIDHTDPSEQKNAEKTIKKVIM
jgi:hypothetical protein